MQNYSFAQPNVAPRENQKNYVFVDEHNRHKRLKVMRACEGCRRRKIKCDAATTNTWPCSACIRLKLTCVPPTANYEKEEPSDEQGFDLSNSQTFDVLEPVADDSYPDQASLAATLAEPLPTVNLNSSSPDPFIKTEPYQPVSYLERPLDHNTLQYGRYSNIGSGYQDGTNALQPQFLDSSTMGISEPNMSMSSSEPGVSDLADALCNLQIVYTGVPQYIVKSKKQHAEEPAMKEDDIQLPEHHTSDNTIAVPPEMMPTDQQAMIFFDYFFTHIHPYVPVVHRSYFYQQWQRNRKSISPLLLEAIFACTTRQMGDPAASDKWLALAAKHEQSFRDIPRLSTVQALLILIKAREAVPKRGHYYRSWMSVVTMVELAKDLELHEHLGLHKQGLPCGSTVFDCVVKSRVWFTLYVVEIMVGGPQGRTEFAVDEDTVDFNVPKPVPGLDESELQINRQYAHFLRVLRNVRGTASLHGSIKKRNKQWALDPIFIEHDKDYTTIIRDLPADMRVNFPADNSAPWIPSHFVAQVHTYHHLTVILQHRPQMHFLSAKADSSWRQHMMISYDSAKQMCRLQEAILRDYGLSGLMCMQRGLAFTIYAILSCTMLHLAALTAPEYELSNDARDYFTRHMRLLEVCVPEWPMPDLQPQITALREAFSVDITKPFELKSTIPYGSPSTVNQTIPLKHESGQKIRGSSHDSIVGPPIPILQQTYPITPPITANDLQFDRVDSPAAAFTMAPNRKPSHVTAEPSMMDQQQWNPSKIFDQWDTAFGIPQATNQTMSPPLSEHPSATFDIMAPPETPHHSNFPSFFAPHVGNSLPTSAAGIPTSAMPYELTQPSENFPMSETEQFVSPSMWRDAVASAFPNGLKRTWDYGTTNSAMMTKAQRRAR